MRRCPGVMEQDREAKGPEQAGVWVEGEVVGGDEGVDSGRVRGGIAYARTAARPSRIKPVSPVST
jgi:hypothetical protein